jgi:hypothetical protein
MWFGYKDVVLPWSPKPNPPTRARARAHTHTHTHTHTKQTFSLKDLVCAVDLVGLVVACGQECYVDLS